MTITIKDDGRGFDSKKEQNGNRYGLIIMEERAASIDGQLSVQSALNQGTTVLLTFPIAEEDRSEVVSNLRRVVELPT